MEAPEERRASQRCRFDPFSSNPVQATIGLFSRAALACDLSSTGVGLLTTDAPPVGAVVPVWLSGDPGGAGRVVLARVANTRRLAPGLYRVGLAGVDADEDAVLAELYRRAARPVSPAG